jgi:hypothetical protein
MQIVDLAKVVKCGTNDQAGVIHDRPVGRERIVEHLIGFGLHNLCRTTDNFLGACRFHADVQVDQNPGLGHDRVVDAAGHADAQAGANFQAVGVRTAQRDAYPLAVDLDVGLGFELGRQRRKWCARSLSDLVSKIKYNGKKLKTN